MRYRTASEACNYVIEQLRGSGLAIQRYDATSTCSIYLKLDYGVANSIRFSDHKGYRYLSYRYNVEVWRRPGKMDSGVNKKGYTKFYYSSNEEELNKMIVDILAYRQEKLDKYGRQNYIQYMKDNIENNKNGDAHRFLAQAELIEKGEYEF